VPRYQYACTECDEQLEVHQSFTDDALTVCPACQGRLRKVFNAVGVVFKGSGFYKTDSRQSAASANGSKDGSGKEGSGKDGSGSSGSESSTSDKGSSEKSSSDKGSSSSGEKSGAGSSSKSSSAASPSPAAP
jgi:putative FmdB family regulatory protein